MKRILWKFSRKIFVLGLFSSLESLFVILWICVVLIMWFLSGLMIRIFFISVVEMIDMSVFF